MRYLCVFLLIWLPIAALAAIYVKEDADTITYSDAPLENGKALEEMPTVNTVAPTTAAASPNTPASTSAEKTTTVQVIDAETKKPYTEFAIVSPKDQETIQNQPVIPIDIKIEPSLQPGDRILLLLDGKPWGEPAETTALALNEVERGVHTVGAVIIDKEQKIVKKSNVVTIYVHRSNLNTPARQQTSAEAKPPINLIQRVIQLFA